MKRRTAIPAKVQDVVLYRNAWTCCVCRPHSRPVKLHHIDENPENNEEVNIAVLCGECHDKAHAKFQLAKNLTAKCIRYAKRCWEAAVSKRSATEMLPKSSWHAHPVWTFVNHERLPQILRSAGVSYNKTKLRKLEEEGLVNEFGVPRPVIEPDNGPGELITVYDRIPFDHRPRLLDLYADGIGKLIVKRSPIDLQRLTSLRQVRSVVSSGDLCYAFKAFYFHSGPKRPNGTQIRQVKTSHAGVAITFQMNTCWMHGESSVNSSFTGHREATALLLVKSCGQRRGKYTLDCTPLALGTGFSRREG